MAKIEIGDSQDGLGLVRDTLVTNSAAMDKKPKGTSKRPLVEPTPSTIDQPQAKRQRGGCVFNLPSSPASNSIVLSQDNSSPPLQKGTRPQ